MPAKRIVIVGGVAGGASAAAKARRTDEGAQITVFERGPYISFANCGLPYYVSGEISDRDDLLLQTPESFKRRFNVDVKVNHEVTAIDRKDKSVTVKDLATGAETHYPYDKLVLSPGARAIRPQVPGVDAGNIFTLKTVPDADALKKFLLEKKPRRALVVGAGFIGLETAEGLVKLGIDTTVVELRDQVLPPLDPDMAVYVSNHLRSAGLNLVLGDGIKAFTGSPLVTGAELTSGKKLETDLVLMSAGVAPETELARAAGLVIGKSGGIEVNERMQTSDPDIYAAGDAAECVQLVNGRKVRMMLAGPANKQGRAAGANAAGADMKFDGALATAIVGTMGITAAKTGLSEREAAAEGIDYIAAVIHPGDHAGYYPGAEMLHLKVLSDRKTGRLIGSQVVGKKGADKRTDVIAAAIAGGMTAGQLAALDLAYAPQFGSAKDPAIVAGMVLENQLRGLSEGLTVRQLEEQLKAGRDLKLIDVRTPGEFNSGSIPGAVNMPVDELRSRLAGLPKEADIVVFCRVGLRGYLAERILRQNGFAKVRNLSGGMISYAAPQEKPAARTICTVGVDEAAAAKAAGGALVDVREPEEYAYEHIEGSVNCPLSAIDTVCGSIPKNAPVYVFCQSGVRSRQAAERLRLRGCSDLRVVEGGLSAWKGKGLPIIKSNGPLPLMRQVQITAGLMILAAVISVKFFWVAGLIGAGLTFAGVTGWCGLAKVLAMMPWNKSFRGASSCALPPGGGAPKSGCCG